MKYSWEILRVICWLFCGLNRLMLNHALIYAIFRPYLPFRALPKAPPLGHNHTHTPKPLNPIG